MTTVSIGYHLAGEHNSRPGISLVSGSTLPVGYMEVFVGANLGWRIYYSEKHLRGLEVGYGWVLYQVLPETPTPAPAIFFLRFSSN